MDRIQKIVKILKVHIDHIEINENFNPDKIKNELLELVKEYTNVDNEELEYIKEKIEIHYEITLKKDSNNEYKRIRSDHIDRKIEMVG